MNLEGNNPNFNRNEFNRKQFSISVGMSLTGNNKLQFQQE